MTATQHTWKFFRAGGFDQVRLETGDDLLALTDLDQKLWAALACPVHGLEFDSKTLELIDSDGDGRIRAPEVLAAVKWAGDLLKDPNDLVRGLSSLPLTAINDATDQGKYLLAAAKEILTGLDKPDAAEISIADTTDTAKVFAQTRFNGDGIVPARSATDDATHTVIEEIIKCMGSEIDRCGEPGINQEKVDQFFTELQRYADWWHEAEANAASVLPLGDATAAGWTAMEVVRAKIDDYFARCRLAEFDARATTALNRSQDDFVALSHQSLSASGQEVAEFPLALVGAGRMLQLKEGLNPAWVEAIATLKREVINPLLGDKSELSASDWRQLQATLAPYGEWLKGKQGAPVESLGIARVREILVSDQQQVLAALIAKDKALEPEMNAITAVDRLVRYCRDLHPLLNNFVAFRDFYDPQMKAVFQAGTLYLDGRSCDLCIRVEDAAKHATLATLSKTYLTYLDCVRKSSGEKMLIAAAITGGDADQLMVGRNGVFYDRQGRDWDATISKIIEHPISIRQAIWLPYKRIGRMIGAQIEKMAASRDKSVTDQAGAHIDTAAKGADASKPAAPQPFDVAKFAGIFAAIGLAVGAIGTAIASVVTGFLGLVWWQMPLALLGIFLIISGPSVVIAALKLRQRNLGPILDANGWAINGRVKINIPFGGSLTRIAALPAGAQRSTKDPYKSSSGLGWFWAVVIIVLVAVAYYFLK